MSNNVYGIDLGTSNFKVFSKSSGKVYQEKNTVAIIGRNQIYAYGDAAYEMYEKAPENIQVCFPVVSGVIADFNYLQEMIFDYISKRMKGHVKGASFVVAVPTAITDVEKRAFYELFIKSKYRPKNVLLCEKPIADAVGLGLDVNRPTGIMIVDLGGDTTEISVISLGGLVISELLNFGGNRLDESIAAQVRKEFGLVIGLKTAKELKEMLGSGLPGRTDTLTVVGRDVVKGLPVQTEIPANVVYDAMKPHLENICASFKLILEKTPPEVAKDIIHSGIYITGGGAQIHNLAHLFEQITNIPVNVAEEPESTSVKGLVRIVSDSKYKNLPFSIKSNPYR